MEHWQQFIVIMAAFSTASQKLTEQLAKGRWLNELDTKKTGVAESQRIWALHFITGVFGITLFVATQIDPLEALRGHESSFTWSKSNYTDHIVSCIVTGILVSFGGSFFNDTLGVLKSFKEAQESIVNQSVSKDKDILSNDFSSNISKNIGTEILEGYDLSYFDKDAHADFEEKEDSSHG